MITAVTAPAPRQAAAVEAPPPTRGLLSLHCKRGGHELCDCWPLCDCDCHAEKTLEADLLKQIAANPCTGKRSVEHVHERMRHRREAREWRRAQRGTDPLHKNARHRDGCHRCGKPTDGGFTNCADCRKKIRDARARKRQHA